MTPGYGFSIRKLKRTACCIMWPYTSRNKFPASQYTRAAHEVGLQPFSSLTTFPLQSCLGPLLSLTTALQSRLAEQLLTRLLLARYSPAVESEPCLRAHLSAFFKSFQVGTRSGSTPVRIPILALSRHKMLDCRMHLSRRSHPMCTSKMYI